MPEAIPFLPFDLADADFKRNPYPTYARLRASTPILRSGSGAIFVSSAAAVAQISADRRFGKAFRQLAERRYGEGAVRRERAFGTMDRWVLHANPPQHTALRAPAVAAFAAKRIEALRSAVADYAATIMEELPRSGEVDLARAFSFKIPTQVICNLFGIPACDREQVFEWSGVHGRFLDPAPQNRAFIDNANDQDAQLSAYFERLCEDRARNPGNDLISALVTGELMPPEDLVPNIIFMFGAGHETTVSTLSNFIIAMGQFSKERQRVVDDPTLMKTAVEEILRYDSSVHTISRVTLEAAEIDGFRFERGDLVYCLTAAANRDPAIHADPDRFDVGRKPGPFYSFGGGVHYCLGAQLARLELTEAMGALLRCAPRYEITDWNLRYRANFTLRGVDEIKVVLH